MLRNFNRKSDVCFNSSDFLDVKGIVGEDVEKLPFC